MITKNIGIFSTLDEANSSLNGSIIIDLNDITTNTTDEVLISKTIGKILAIAANREMKIVLQAEDINIPSYLMAAIFVYATGLDWDDAIDLVGSKLDTGITIDITTELCKKLMEVVKY